MRPLVRVKCNGLHKSILTTERQSQEQLLRDIVMTFCRDVRNIKTIVFITKYCLQGIKQKIKYAINRRPSIQS